MWSWISQVHVVLHTHLNMLLTYKEGKKVFLISNFCRVLNVVCFLLGNCLVSE